MGPVRSNRIALLAVAAFFIVFLSLAHYRFDLIEPASKIVNLDSIVENGNDASSVTVEDPIDTTKNDSMTPPDTLDGQPDKQSNKPENANQPGLDEMAKLDSHPASPGTTPPTTLLNVATKPTESPKPTPNTPDVGLIRPQQWIQPAVKPDDPEYYFFDAFPVKLPSDKPIWTKPLGERLCIIDMESRSFNKPNQIWSPEGMSWKLKGFHGPSGGSLIHWVYAKIHGYKYYYINIEGYPDRRDSWKKPSILTKVLKKHDVCVFIDSDALFHRMDLPIEWLMNYWKISPQNNSMALPFDPPVPHNLDRFGNYLLNTGFMILQNKERTYEIFKAWDECPNEGGKHPDCKEFRHRKGWQPTDQGGFGTFIRYDYPDDIMSLPCDEANGFPESKSGCNGKFIKHVWLGKEDMLNVAVGHVLPGILLDTFHKQFLAEKDSFYTTEAELMAT